MFQRSAAFATISIFDAWCLIYILIFFLFSLLLYIFRCFSCFFAIVIAMFLWWCSRRYLRPRWYVDADYWSDILMLPPFSSLIIFDAAALPVSLFWCFFFYAATMIFVHAAFSTRFLRCHYAFFRCFAHDDADSHTIFFRCPPRFIIDSFGAALMMPDWCFDYLMPDVLFWCFLRATWGASTRFAFVDAHVFFFLMIDHRHDMPLLMLAAMMPLTLCLMPPRALPTPMLLMLLRLPCHDSACSPSMPAMLSFTMSPDILSPDAWFFTRCSISILIWRVADSMPFADFFHALMFRLLMPRHAFIFDVSLPHSSFFSFALSFSPPSPIISLFFRWFIDTAAFFHAWWCLRLMPISLFSLRDFVTPFSIISLYFFRHISATSDADILLLLPLRLSCWLRHFFRFWYFMLMLFFPPPAIFRHRRLSSFDHGHFDASSPLFFHWFHYLLSLFIIVERLFCLHYFVTLFLQEILPVFIYASTWHVTIDCSAIFSHAFSLHLRCSRHDYYFRYTDYRFLLFDFLALRHFMPDYANRERHADWHIMPHFSFFFIYHFIGISEEIYSRSYCLPDTFLAAYHSSLRAQRVCVWRRQLRQKRIRCRDFIFFIIITSSLISLLFLISHFLFSLFRWCSIITAFSFSPYFLLRRLRDYLTCRLLLYCHFIFPIIFTFRRHTTPFLHSDIVFS